MIAAYRAEQTAVVVVITIVVLAALGPARAWVRRHPRTSLALLVAADFVYMLWATTPFIPHGIDESFFAINAHRYAGAELYNCWIRTPLPGLVGALTPWQPVLFVLVCKELAAILAFAVARPALGDGGALWAALLTVVASRLARYSAFFLGESYAAASLIAFVYFVARGRTALAAWCAGLAFISRWQLLVLAPLALLAGFLRRRVVGTLVAAALVALPAAVTIPWTELDPVRAAQQNSGHLTTFPERLLGYFDPRVGLGIGLQGLALALIGAATALPRAAAGRAQLLWCAVAFGTCSAAALALGVVMPNYMTAAVPAGCVLMAAGSTWVSSRAWLARRSWVSALLAVGLAVVHALPIDPPKSREARHGSPQAIVQADRSAFLAALGEHPLYTEVEFLAMCAVIARPVHAVTGEGCDHPTGVDLDWEGLWPHVPRSDLAPGSRVLTLTPAGHEVLWRGGALSLVRW